MMRLISAIIVMFIQSSHAISFINVSNFVTTILKLHYLSFIYFTCAIKIYHKQVYLEIVVVKVNNFRKDATSVCIFCHPVFTNGTYSTNFKEHE